MRNIVTGQQTCVVTQSKCTVTCTVVTVYVLLLHLYTVINILVYSYYHLTLFFIIYNICEYNFL